MASVSTLARSSGATSPSRRTNLSITWRLSRWPAHLFDILADAVDGVGAASETGSGGEKGETQNRFSWDSPYQRISRTSAKRPAIAAAAAMAGLTRWCAPGPCRPSKLRLEVEAQRSPGSSRSAFMARHMEQPGSRHSNPAATKTLSRPFGLGLALDQAGPRNHQGQLDVGGDVAPLGHPGRLAQVFDAGIGARTDEYLVDPDVLDRRVGVESHVLQGPLHAFALDRIGLAGWIGHGGVDGHDHFRRSAPGHLGPDVAGVELTTRSKRRPRRT